MDYDLGVIQGHLKWHRSGLLLALYRRITRLVSCIISNVKRDICRKMATF